VKSIRRAGRPTAQATIFPIRGSAGFNVSVIPSEVEAATQPRKLSGRGQAFNPVA